MWVVEGAGSGGADLRENRLRLFVRSAAMQTGDGLVRLGADRGNPLDGLAETLSCAWTGTSAARTCAIDQVRTVGVRVRGGFDDARSDLDGRFAHHPVMIDVAAHSDQRWMASDSQIQARTGIHTPRVY